MSRRLFPFHGGVHPEPHKRESNTTPIRAMPLLPRYVVPMRQHIGEPARPVVHVGDYVLRGQIIGEAQGYVSTAVHAPTSGRVVALEPRPAAHPSGLYDLAAVIEADGDDRAVAFQPLDWRTMDASALRNRVRDLGVAGLGGAVFPSYVKLNPGAQRIHTLIVNGAECEPWITCDDRLMRERAGETLRGIAIMRHCLGAEQVLIGIEDNKPEAIAAMRAALTTLDADGARGVEIVVVPSIYPAGGGKQLTYLLTGLETPSGGRSTDLGIQVFNVGTAYALWRAVELGEPLLSRVVTVTGHVAAPGNFEARLGTPLVDLIAAAGGELPGAAGEIVGGPMMGFDLMDDAAPVTKAVNCVIVKNTTLFPPRAPDLPCIRCDACARACPVVLQPFDLYWYSRAKDFGRAQSYHLFDCIECGCCSYVCPSHIPLVDYFRYAKSEIWQREREKLAADQARQRHEFKTFRLEREKREKAEKFAKAAEKTKAAAAAPVDADAERKQALLKAAMERAQKAKAAVQPKNVDNLPPAVQREIDEIEARRAAARDAAEHHADTGADK